VFSSPSFGPKGAAMKKFEGILVFRGEQKVSASVEEFGNIVYVELTKVSLGENFTIGFRKPVESEPHVDCRRFAIPLSRYKNLLKRHGEDPLWLWKIDYADTVEDALTKEFLDAYKLGKAFSVDYKLRRDERPLYDVLKAGDFDLIAKDWTSKDHTVRDINNEVIPRDLYFDYMSRAMRNTNFRLKSLLEHLQKHPNVRDAQIEEVPHYIVEEFGVEAVHFRLTAGDNQELRQIIDKGNLDYNDQNRIFEILGVEQFRIIKD
jgi:hypothetical protein